MWRRSPIGQDIDQFAGAVQIDCAMTPPMDSRMDHALGALKRRLQPSPGRKINTGPPAR
jgi:hypothetical protein